MSNSVCAQSRSKKRVWQDEVSWWWLKMVRFCCSLHGRCMVLLVPFRMGRNRSHQWLWSRIVPKHRCWGVDEDVMVQNDDGVCCKLDEVLQVECGILKVWDVRCVRTWSGVLAERFSQSSSNLGKSSVELSKESSCLFCGCKCEVRLWRVAEVRPVRTVDRLVKTYAVRWWLVRQCRIFLHQSWGFGTSSSCRSGDVGRKCHSLRFLRNFAD